ncbi:DUF1343 domain-containing protein [Candidatus Dependentiae bacterium]|nr:DUF1343 domain-containing protein [Candidatus Dependentiae bacterium]
MNTKLRSFIKLLCIVYLVIFIPEVISEKGKTKQEINNGNRYLTSVENLLKNKRFFYGLKKYEMALITDLYEFKNINPLLNQGFKIKSLFVLDEKGKFQNQQFNEIKNKKISVFKLDKYKKDFQNSLNNVNAVIFNVRTFGTRNDPIFDILLNTMLYALKNDKRVIILDKPNPLSGFIEGSGRIPIQYGLTVAELAKYFNNYILQKPIKLTVIPMIGWKRGNDKNISSYLYQKNLLDFLSKIEPINKDLDETLLKKTLLLPNKSLSMWEMGYLEKICKRLGFYCKNYSYYNKNKKNYLKGFCLSSRKNLKKFSSFNAMLTLARFFKNRKKIKFNYLDSFDKILGSDDAKKFLNNKISFEDLRVNIQRSLQDFYFKSKKILLYKPYPVVNDVKILKS